MRNISIVVHSKSSYQQYSVNEKYVAKHTERESTPQYKLKIFFLNMGFWSLVSYLRPPKDQSRYSECPPRA